MYSSHTALQAIQAIRRSAAFWLERATFASLAFLALSFAVEALRYPIAIGPQSFTNLEVLQFIVSGLWIAYNFLRVQDDGRWKDVSRGFSIAVGLWLVALAVSTLLASGHLDHVLTFDSRILRGVVLAWITFDVVRTHERWTTLIRCLALGGIMISIVGLAEVANIPHIQDWLVRLRGTSIRVGELLRLSSTLAHPNITAIAIEMTLFPLLAWVLTTRRRWLSLCLGLGLLAGIVALVLTFSRGGLLAFAVSLVVVIMLALYFQGRQRRRLMIGVVAVIAGLTAVVALLVLRDPVVALRFVTEDDQSWYQATIVVSDQVSAQPGETVMVPVTLTNAGQLTWEAGGDHAFHLSYHLLSVANGSRFGLQYEGQRTTLPHDVAPGQTVSVTAAVIAPPNSGEYVIEWDMVQEQVTWFNLKSASNVETQLTLSGEPVADAAPFIARPFADASPLRWTSRLMLWKVALQMVQAHPLFGVGPDNFRELYGMYLGYRTWNANIHANNLYLELAADTGIVGFLAFMLMSLMLARTAGSSLRQHLDDPLWLWQLALIGSLVAWYVHGVVDFFYEFTPINTVFWILVGLSVATWREDRAAREVNAVQD